MSKILSLARYGDVKALSGAAASMAVSAIVESFEGVPKDTLVNRYAFSAKAGMFYIFTSAAHPGKIVEHVMGLNGDTVSALYAPHPIFNTPGDLLAAREDLIEMIESSENAAPGKLKMMDEGRARPIFLQEMATAQLIDLVQRAMLRRGVAPTVAG